MINARRLSAIIALLLLASCGHAELAYAAVTR